MRFTGSAGLNDPTANDGVMGDLLGSALIGSGGIVVYRSVVYVEASLICLLLFTG